MQMINVYKNTVAIPCRPCGSSVPSRPSGSGRLQAPRWEWILCGETRTKTLSEGSAWLCLPKYIIPFHDTPGQIRALAPVDLPTRPHAVGGQPIHMSPKSGREAPRAGQGRPGRPCGTRLAAAPTRHKVQPQSPKKMKVGRERFELTITAVSRRYPNQLDYRPNKLWKAL